jgi:hypothetical protein
MAQPAWLMAQQGLIQHLALLPPLVVARAVGAHPEFLQQVLAALVVVAGRPTFLNQAALGTLHQLARHKEMRGEMEYCQHQIMAVAVVAALAQPAQMARQLLVEMAEMERPRLFLVGL